jgi:hypothetical protein
MVVTLTWYDVDAVPYGLTYTPSAPDVVQSACRADYDIGEMRF